MEKQNQLIRIVLDTLYQQEMHLTRKDKKEFPLVYRAIAAINEVWNSNNVPILRMEVDSITTDQVRLQVNESSPVTYITFQTVRSHV